MNRLLQGSIYLLTDIKKQVFEDEPAVYTGRQDSDMGCPSICAVCGERLGGTGYAAFHLVAPEGREQDVLIGPKCMNNRLVCTETGIKNDSEVIWTRAIADFPKSGRWYGTFLHNLIAKPYVRDPASAECWDESVLNLPGVRFIMRIIDHYRKGGWELDAERIVDNGRIDLIATHHSFGTVVLDWKSDRSFANHDEYVTQVRSYMRKVWDEKGEISGKILWVVKEQIETVTYPDERPVTRSIPAAGQKLKIDLNGGEGHPEYDKEDVQILNGDIVFTVESMYIYKEGYELARFEASPYEGRTPQIIDGIHAETGFNLVFKCDNRNTFTLTAIWEPVRPYKCQVIVTSGYWKTKLPVRKSMIDADGNDYFEVCLSELEDFLTGDNPFRIVAVNGGSAGKNEWGRDDFEDGKIRIACYPECKHYLLQIDTMKKQNFKTMPADTSRKEKIPALPADRTDAGSGFATGLVYAHGDRQYKICTRSDPRKPGTRGMVQVIESDADGVKIAGPEWRHIYLQSGKEFIYGLSDFKQKIFAETH